MIVMFGCLMVSDVLLRWFAIRWCGVYVCRFTCGLVLLGCCFKLALFKLVVATSGCCRLVL